MKLADIKTMILIDIYNFCVETTIHFVVRDGQLKGFNEYK